MSGAPSIVAYTMASAAAHCAERAAIAVQAAIASSGRIIAARGPNCSAMPMANVKAKRPDQARYQYSCDDQNPRLARIAAVQ